MVLFAFHKCCLCVNFTMDFVTN